MTNNSFHKGYVFLAACIGMLLFGIVMISLGSILPEVIEKFQLDEVGTGTMLTLLPFGILTGSLIFGPLVDWLSYKIVLITGSVFTLLGIEGLVFSEIMTPMYFSVFCIGFGGGILNGVTNALVSEISEDDHSANLSLLGVFFGIGALGTPMILGLVKGVYTFETILAWFGAFMFLPILFFVFNRFPKSAGTEGLPVKEWAQMVKDPLLLLLGGILFFQSGIEGLTNNWTTTYLEMIKGIEASNALFILSSFVGALTVTRIILGKVLRILSPFRVLVFGFIIAFLGCFCMVIGDSFLSSILGMIAIGVGLAAGFPVVLGYIGQTYTQLSGTAFSIVITIALIGNVIANYVMGLASQAYGLEVLPYFVVCAVLAIFILLYITKQKYKTVIN
ncbi:MFS transporter [Flavobacteriaceae bacterium F89]|uniref:MFS transporter n=1 Tax=Cerina litoralis TaxID=2874477 RepID=A0AAE3EXW3_9FLAO|nr:MFS transporter [Cerina litoralis]MCG2462144.1 MFS transporter [Cerina litoralis]